MSMWCGSGQRNIEDWLASAWDNLKNTLLAFKQTHKTRTLFLLPLNFISQPSNYNLISRSPEAKTQPNESEPEDRAYSLRMTKHQQGKMYPKDGRLRKRRLARGFFWCVRSLTALIIKPSFRQSFPKAKTSQLIPKQILITQTCSWKWLPGGTQEKNPVILLSAVYLNDKGKRILTSSFWHSR